MLRLAHCNWVDRADRIGPACQSGLVQQPCAEMQQNLLDVLGTVDEDHSFSRAADGQKIVGPVQSFLREPVASLADATIEAINVNMGHEHFCERMAVLYLSTFW